MKKIISMLLVVVFLLSFVACGSNEGEKEEIAQENAIELTLDNYADFLNVDISVVPHTTETWYFNESNPSASRITTYKGADCFAEITGNSHYKFNEVYLDIKFDHYTLHQEEARLNGENVEPFSSYTITVKLNLSGEGSGDCSLDTLGSNWKNYNTPQTNVIDAMCYKDTDAITERTYYTVIAVRGSVTEY